MGILKTTDTAINDSDKSFVLPAGSRWKLLYARVNFTSTATVGNRQIVLRILDAVAGNVMFETVAGLVHAASVVRDYNFGTGLPRESAVVDGQVSVPIPDSLILSAGMVIEFLDSAAIDAAADDMNVFFVVDAE